jgi:hypothetical protein
MQAQLAPPVRAGAPERVRRPLVSERRAGAGCLGFHPHTEPEFTGGARVAVWRRDPAMAFPEARLPGRAGRGATWCGVWDLRRAARLTELTQFIAYAPPRSVAASRSPLENVTAMGNRRKIVTAAPALAVARTSASGTLKRRRAMTELEGFLRLRIRLWRRRLESPLAIF